MSPRTPVYLGIPCFWTKGYAGYNYPKMGPQWEDPKQQGFDWRICKIYVMLLSILKSGTVSYWDQSRWAMIIFTLRLISPVNKQLSQLGCPIFDHPKRDFSELRRFFRGFLTSGGDERTRWRSNATGEAQRALTRWPVKPLLMKSAPVLPVEGMGVMWLEHSDGSKPMSRESTFHSPAIIRYRLGFIWFWHITIWLEIPPEECIARLSLQALGTNTAHSVGCVCCALMSFHPSSPFNLFQLSFVLNSGFFSPAGMMHRSRTSCESRMLTSSWYHPTGFGKLQRFSWILMAKVRVHGFSSWCIKIHFHSLVAFHLLGPDEKWSGKPPSRNIKEDIRNAAACLVDL